MHFISSALYLLPSHRRKSWTESCPIWISVEHHIKEKSVITHLSIRQPMIHLLCVIRTSYGIKSNSLCNFSSTYQIRNLIKADSEIRFAWQDLYSSKSCWLSIIIFSPFNSLWFKFCISLSPIFSRTCSKTFLDNSQCSCMELVQACWFEFVYKLWLDTQSLIDKDIWWRKSTKSIFAKESRGMSCWLLLPELSSLINQ